MTTYQRLFNRPTRAPTAWGPSCTYTESTLHQLSPYIGKLKSTIAHDLISTFSKKGDIVADVFCGSGTIPFESVKLGRRTFAADASRYAITLTKGKLYAPHDNEAANSQLNRSFATAKLSAVGLSNVPQWVQDFYHPDTLREILRLIPVLIRRKQYFLLACLLGISHHQRPGFLSFPSSHLVPYLRTRLFPFSKYPELYEYRNVKPRLRAKVNRALKRHIVHNRDLIVAVRRSTVEHLTPPPLVHCYLTSPPYMNALDYGRDNRLRNWLLTGYTDHQIDTRLSGVAGFRRMIRAYLRLVSKTLVAGGYCVFVVGEKTKRDNARFPSAVLSETVDQLAPELRLTEIITDCIPDVRRSRRNLDGVKMENILVYQNRA